TPYRSEEGDHLFYVDGPNCYWFARSFLKSETLADAEFLDGYEWNKEVEREYTLISKQDAKPGDLVMIYRVVSQVFIDPPEPTQTLVRPILVHSAIYLGSELLL